MTVDELVAETRDMSQDMRAELVERIILAAHGGVNAQMQEAWTTEVSRRINEIQKGQAKGIPLDEALTELRKRFDP